MRNRSGKGRARSFVMLVVMAASCLGQNPPRAAGEKPASVEGVTVNSITGAPVPRAHVKLAGNSPGVQHDYGAMTNAEGKFAMTNVPPGSYLLRAERTGFVTFGDDASRRTAEIVLGPGDHREDVRLRLTPAGAIAGRVIGSAGEPMELVTVVAESRDPALSSDAITDGDGQFRIGGLRPGTYWVKARPMNGHRPPETRTDGSVEVQYAQTYAQSALSRTAAARIVVPPGGEVSGIEVRLAQVPIISLRGKVLGLPKSGEQEGSFWVSLCQPDGCRGVGRGTRADGSFEAWRPEVGKNYLKVEERVGGQVLRAAPVEIEVGESSIDNIELVALPPMDILGRLEYSDPAARQQTSSPQRQGQPPTAPHRLLLREVGGDASPKPAQIGPDESFKLEGVPPGRFLVGVSWPGAYVKAVRLGTTEMNDGILDLRRGYGGQPLTVLVSSAVGQVSGAVRKGDGPAAAARLALVPEGPEGAEFALFTTAGAGGEYSFVGIRPAKYTLVALDDDDSEAAVRTSGVDIYEGFSETVEIHDNEKLTKDLKQRPL